MEFISLQSDVIVFIYHWCGKAKDFVLLSAKKHDSSPATGIFAQENLALLLKR